MQKWQKARNYRKYKRADGTVAYVIRVDGEDVEVSAVVYKAYSQADRRERYCAERDAGRLLSLDRFEENGITLETLFGWHIESAEDLVIQAMLTERAAAAFMSLEPGERSLIQALVIDGVTERDYAGQIGMSQMGVNKRKHKILEKLSKLVFKPS